MALSLFNSKKRIINLVINDHSIRFVELKSSTPPAPSRWGERFLPPGIISDGKITNRDALVNILEECISEWKIQHRTIRFIVPDPLVIIRKVSIPAEIQDDELKGYLYLELGSTIHLPFEEPIFDFYTLTNNGKTRDVLLFAAPEQYVTEYSKLFSGLRLAPIAADISPLALYRLYYQLDKAMHNEVLFTIQFDLTSVNLSIFEETVPLVMRQFPLPFNIDHWDIRHDVSGNLGYKFTGDPNELVIQFEDIFKEMNKLFDFYRYTLNSEKHDISKFLLNGDHPMLSAIYEEMLERFEVPVEIISLPTDKSGSVPANFLLPLGLALKEVN
jgi:type IV pilus assembly protein PilM